MGLLPPRGRMDGRSSPYADGGALPARWRWYAPRFLARLVSAWTCRSASRKPRVVDLWTPAAAGAPGGARAGGRDPTIEPEPRVSQVEQRRKKPSPSRGNAGHGCRNEGEGAQARKPVARRRSSKRGARVAALNSRLRSRGEATARAQSGEALRKLARQKATASSMVDEHIAKIRRGSRRAPPHRCLPINIRVL